jgi:hypothetical protein
LAAARRQIEVDTLWRGFVGETLVCAFEGHATGVVVVAFVAVSASRRFLYRNSTAQAE